MNIHAPTDCPVMMGDKVVGKATSLRRDDSSGSYWIEIKLDEDDSTDLVIGRICAGKWKDGMDDFACFGEEKKDDAQTTDS